MLKFHFNFFLQQKCSFIILTILKFVFANSLHFKTRESFKISLYFCYRLTFRRTCIKFPSRKLFSLLSSFFRNSIPLYIYHFYFLWPVLGAKFKRGIQEKRYSNAYSWWKRNIKLVILWQNFTFTMLLRWWVECWDLNSRNWLHYLTHPYRTLLFT